MKWTIEREGCRPHLALIPDDERIADVLVDSQTGSCVGGLTQESRAETLVQGAETLLLDQLGSYREL